MDYNSITVSQQQLNNDVTLPMLSEDYAEIGLGEEEGDYSTPAARNYELDRTQITLNEIIGVGQFGDVHIGTCRIKQKTGNCQTAGGQLFSSKTDSSHKVDESGVVSITTTTNGEHNSENKTGITQVAVKTCKSDADMTTSEKFLEEACKGDIYFFLSTYHSFNNI